MATEAQEMPYIDPHNLQLLQALGALANGKSFSEYPIQKQREMFSTVQTPRRQNAKISVTAHAIQTSHGEVETYLYMPSDAKGPLGLIYYVHGGGWIFGGAAEFESFVFDLVEKSGCAVVFPEYTLAPEKKFPVQQDQCLEVLLDVLKVGADHGLSTDRVVLAGDSPGGKKQVCPCVNGASLMMIDAGQIVAAMSILNHQRSLNLPITHQLLLHPYIDVTAPLTKTILHDPIWAEQQISSYFSTPSDRSSILGSPGRMSAEEAKGYMPSTTLVISDQDPFRDQDEAFVKLLQTAGVPCGVVMAVGSLHDVEVFHQAREGETAELVMLAIAGKMKNVLGVE